MNAGVWRQVSLTLASWNHIQEWLSRIEWLRKGRLSPFDATRNLGHSPAVERPPDRTRAGFRAPACKEIRRKQTTYTQARAPRDPRNCISSEAICMPRYRTNCMNCSRRSMFVLGTCSIRRRRFGVRTESTRTRLQSVRLVLRLYADRPSKRDPSARRISRHNRWAFQRSRFRRAAAEELQDASRTSRPFRLARIRGRPRTHHCGSTQGGHRRRRTGCDE